MSASSLGRLSLAGPRGEDRRLRLKFTELPDNREEFLDPPKRVSPLQICKFEWETWRVSSIVRSSHLPNQTQDSRALFALFKSPKVTQSLLPSPSFIIDDVLPLDKGSSRRAHAARGPRDEQLQPTTRHRHRHRHRTTTTPTTTTTTPTQHTQPTQVQEIQDRAKPATRARHHLW